MGRCLSFCAILRVVRINDNATNYYDGLLLLSYLFILSIPGDVCSRNVSCALSDIYVFMKIIISYLHQVRIDITGICIYFGPIDTLQAICLSYVVVPW